MASLFSEFRLSLLISEETQERAGEMAGEGEDKERGYQEEAMAPEFQAWWRRNHVSYMQDVLPELDANLYVDMPPLWWVPVMRETVFLDTWMIPAPSSLTTSTWSPGEWVVWRQQQSCPPSWWSRRREWFQRCYRDFYRIRLENDQAFIYSLSPADVYKYFPIE